MDVAGAIARMRPRIVQIRFTAADLPPKAPQQTISGLLGTGFLINSTGVIITAHHVVEEARKRAEKAKAGKLQLIIGYAHSNKENMRGNFTVVPATILGEDVRHDLALLKSVANPFEGEVRSGIRIGDQDLPLDFDVVTLDSGRPVDGLHVGISGYPLNQPVLITNVGWLASSWTYEYQQTTQPGSIPVPETVDRYLADVEINSGNSGGPVYSIDTTMVIGVCVATKGTHVWDETGEPAEVDGRQLAYSSGLTIVVPAKFVVELLEQHGLVWSRVAEG